MKTAIIGAGNVGKAIFHDLQYVNLIQEITLVDRDQNKAQAEVMDARDAAVLREAYAPRLFSGGYEATEGADIIIYTAGYSKLQKDRAEMLAPNCAIAEEIFTEISKFNKDAIILCVTNPLDIITMKIQQVTGRDPHKVIGTGTLLESARLVRFVAELLDLSDRSIHISVVGEHGASAVALLSSVRVMGLPLEEYLRSVTDERVTLNAARLNDAFKKEASRIFYGKGYTSTGVSAAACRVVQAIVSDSRDILPVSSVLHGEYGIQNIAVSVPSIIGRNGIEEIRECAMTDTEREAFLSSVETIRQLAKTVEIM